MNTVILPGLQGKNSHTKAMKTSYSLCRMLRNEAMSMLYRIFLDLVPVPIISERFLMDTLER